ncbi:neuropeptide receptor A18 [Brachionus plicatilis]|uniref:Neuropeptide receptor A18 n=1 Tax=Brachionus plicatilis TaxID=10195 RepID=A0A3M7PDM1_BRAPC|nr:neuropeptide receptor A18 [Brachionus plicatilis]
MNFDQTNETFRAQFMSTYQTNFYELSKWLNVILITLITAIGIYGNLVSIYIFTKTKSTNRGKNFTFYFLLLSLSDLSVLVFHYIDFTFRSWINLTHSYSSKFNFVDKTISVYILLAMTIQRFIFFYLPLKRSIVSSMKTNRIIISTLVIFSLILNSGNLITNTLTKHETNGEYYCNINPKPN